MPVKISTQFNVSPTPARLLHVPLPLTSPHNRLSPHLRTPRQIYAAPTTTSALLFINNPVLPLSNAASSLFLARNRNQKTRRTSTIKCRYSFGNPNKKNSVEIDPAEELAAREFTWFYSLKELLGHTGNDPGHWNYSPEWWGSQGGCFGRNEGHVVFSKMSKYNGLVEVTSHSASLSGFNSKNTSNGLNGDETRQEWRVLRFNHVTRQSVARVAITSDAGVEGSSARPDMQQRRWLEKGQVIIAQPDCVAQEYLKTMISVFGALLGLQGLFASAGSVTTSAATTSPPASSRRQISVLCIGLGGGTLPHFIARHFPQARVDVVEIDEVVVEAATTAMGLPVSSYSNFHLYTQDAYEFLRTRCLDSRNNVFLYDIVCIDAFDGENNVPAQLCSAEFADMLAAVLNENHGTVLMNLHNKEDVECIGKTFYESLVLGKKNKEKNIDEVDGCCFSVQAQMQENFAMVCARGLKLPFNVQDSKQMLRYAGVYVGHESGYRFPAAGVRAQRKFSRLY
jgi:hypothetical protein